MDWVPARDFDAEGFWGCAGMEVRRRVRMRRGRVMETGYRVQRTVVSKL
jgi:hypothetical protein